MLILLSRFFDVDGSTEQIENFILYHGVGKTGGIIPYINKIVWRLILLFLILPFPIHAYEINCDIQVIPYNFSELVTTDSFRLNTTITNVGNSTFPPTEVNITVYNPDNIILDDYYSLNFSLPILKPNKSFFYEKPYKYKNETYYTLYEMPMAGTWKVKVEMLSPPLDDLTYTHVENVVRGNGVCLKYFYVKDMGQYHKEKQDIALQKQNEEFLKQIQERNEKYQESNDNLQKRIENLTVAMWLLAFISAFNIFRNIGKEYKNFLVGFVSLFISLYVIVTTYQNKIFLAIVGLVGIIISFLIMVESEEIREYKNLYRLFLIIIFFIVSGFCIDFIFKNITDYLLITFIFSGMIIFTTAVIELWRDISQ